MMNSNVQAAMPKFAGLSHVCIFVDDMMEAVDYYQKLLGVVPDHYLSHWRNEGFFKAGGFVKEAADGDVSIAFCKCTGHKTDTGTHAVPFTGKDEKNLSSSLPTMSAAHVM